MIREVDAHFKRALYPRWSLQKPSAGNVERDELTATEQGLVLNTSPKTALCHP